MKNSKGYGVFFGRFQPFHKGHKSVIDQIIKDGLIPLILLGSSNKPVSEKNPYTPKQRANMIKLCYPNTNLIAFPLNDFDSDTDWFNNIIELITVNVTRDISKFTFYTFNKDEDRSDFTIRGIPFLNSFYSNAFSLNGFKTKDVTGTFDIPIRATLIREDLESNKDFLEPEVYQYVKSLNYKK